LEEGGREGGRARQSFLSLFLLFLSALPSEHRERVSNNIIEKTKQKKKKKKKKQKASNKRENKKENNSNNNNRERQLKRNQQEEESRSEEDITKERTTCEENISNARARALFPNTKTNNTNFFIMIILIISLQPTRCGTNKRNEGRAAHYNYVVHHVGTTRVQLAFSLMRELGWGI
jgi:flagellar biosynthesis GTPase FlhF